MFPVRPKAQTPQTPAGAPAPERPKPEAPLLVSDFEAIVADPNFAKEEMPGNVSWLGGTLPFIKAEGGLPFVNLPAKLLELVQHCWTAGQRPQDPRIPNNPTIGAGARVNHIPNTVSALQGQRTPQGIIGARLVQDRNLPYQKQVHPLSGGDDPIPHLASIVPTDWKVTEELTRVNAYTFRGDTRPPLQIEAAGGFHPPIQRNDQQYVDGTVFPKFRDYMMRRFQIKLDKAEFDRAYKKHVVFEQDRMVIQNFCVWTSMVENEAYHVGRMLSSETLKGYISTCWPSMANRSD